MNYDDLVESLVEDILSERIHNVRSKDYPAFDPGEREIFRGDSIQSKDVEDAGDHVGGLLAKQIGDSSPSSFLYRPASKPSESPTIRGLQGTDRIGTEPAHVQYGLTPGHRLADETGVEIAGPALYTSPHASVHIGGADRPTFVLHAGPGDGRLFLGTRKDPETSTGISHNLARLALDKVVTARDRTVERRHSTLSPSRYLNFREGSKGNLEYGGDAKELDKYVNDYTDPDVLKGLSTVDRDWKMGQAGMWLSRRFRENGVGSVVTFPTSLKGKSARIVIPHQERLRSYWGHHPGSTINAETDWSKLAER